MMKHTTTLLFLLFVHCCFAQDAVKKIDSIMKATSALHPRIGMSVGFISNGKEYNLNYGYTNRTDKVETDISSIYEIGSITKLFTAYLIAQQVELGTLDLDHPIDEYLPSDFKLNPGIAGKIKASDLASHQSGLPDFDFKKLMVTNPEQPLDQVTQEMVSSILSSTSELASQGNYQYSNISYALLGCMLETVTSSKYEDLIKNRILAPFSMPSTLTSNYKTPGMTTGYSAKGEQKAFFNWNSVIAPAGLVKSNSADMLAFIKQLLEPENEAINALLEHTYFKNTFIELGLGLNIIRENGTVIFAKTGDTLGQSSVLAYNPEENWGIVILTNQATGTARQAFEQILEVLD